jgi:two-component system cell cycle response regulator
MHDGKKQAGKRPNFLALVKDGKSPRDSALATTLPFGLETVAEQAEEMTDITSPGTPRSSPVCDRGTLTMVSGNEAGSVYRLTVSTMVGRSPDCEIQIDHAGVSRRHARIVREAETEYVVQDLGSRNGVTVRGRPVTRCRLVDGDRIGFGPMFFRFALADEREEQALRQRYEFSVVDGLTGALNRKHFDDRLVGELAYAKRHASELLLLILDVDHFKAVNDRLGHQAGDSVLRQLATGIKTILRAEDVFARYGGEEFATIARGIPGKEALGFADRIRHLVEKTRFVHENNSIAITVSIGVATLADCKEPSVDQLIRAADAGLYAAKASGRNCCKHG